ncbi:hypothetical protein LROSL1_0437 [Furfurilactobacillus rossiae]|uniref:methyltransferase domain-containing protein n=1 Tax=Furfurilactobacillus rossiae TaxID=231049 RepID=UPI0015C05FCA|nr:methyltransferase domain-containing protein [Furfurilactobacillus rossiae]MCF6166084.1 methyltransferase domain-containing protein [Furfurilactobacillus rossiae]QLE63257.1 hypothetical protein LROSL1_0437 [Furfurilactobacillus rossiae]
MNDLDLTTIVNAMALAPNGRTVQEHQTAYRIALAVDWQIKPGMKLLELGCGQGDMTAVLGAAVGETGQVVAYDPAPLDYGAPITIGEAQKHLANSSFGKELEVHLATDVMRDDITYPDNYFDGLVIAHASWYFDSLEQLQTTLRKVAPWCKRIFFAEWDITPRLTNQFPHQLAVLIETQLAAFTPNSFANVRTLVTKEWLVDVIHKLGYTVQTTDQDALKMEDGYWEASYTAETGLAAVTAMSLPDKFKQLMETEIHTLQAYDLTQMKTLDSFVVTATRNDVQ